MATKSVRKAHVDAGYTHHKAVVDLGRVLQGASIELPKDPASFTVEASSKNPDTGETRKVGVLSISRGGLKWTSGRRTVKKSWRQFAELMAEQSKT